jgi:hypothetical protein
LRWGEGREIVKGEGANEPCWSCASVSRKFVRIEQKGIRGKVSIGRIYPIRKIVGPEP